ncbi:MAG: HNH endonuclease [Candidatus Thiodiazotropha sp.]
MINVCSMCGKVRKLTLEHIIPQSLGSPLEKRIYCNDCNSNLGHELDAELAERFGLYATLLKVKRKRGKNQEIIIVDEESDLRLKFNGDRFCRLDPIVKTKKNKDGKIEEVEVVARSPNERDHIFMALARKHNFDISIVVSDEVEYPPPTNLRDLVFEGEIIYRAIAKIAYGFASWKLPTTLILSDSFESIRRYIKGRSSEKLVSANYMHTDFMTDNQRPLHKVYISFNRASGIIVGYVALFGVFRYTVLLSDSFNSYIEWPGIDYTFNPVTQREVPANLIFKSIRPVNPSFQI